MEPAKLSLWLQNYFEVIESHIAQVASFGIKIIISRAWENLLYIETYKYSQLTVRITSEKWKKNLIVSDTSGTGLGPEICHYKCVFYNETCRITNFWETTNADPHTCTVTAKINEIQKRVKRPSSPRLYAQSLQPPQHCGRSGSTCPYSILQYMYMHTVWMQL